MDYETLMGLTFLVLVIIFALGLMPRSGERRRSHSRARPRIAAANQRLSLG
jgi:hypothetical protein